MSIELIKAIDEHLRYGLWHIKEQEELLREHYLPSIDEKEELDGFKFEGRRLEWLASRLMFRELYKGEEKLLILKDQYGKPYVENKQWQISISHTKSFAAALLCDRGRSIGIDIEHVTPRVERIADKFTSREEQSIWLGEEDESRAVFLTKVWAAKEAVYKMYGRKQLDFINDLPFVAVDDQKGLCIKLLRNYEVWVQLDHYNDLLIAWAISEEGII